MKIFEKAKQLSTREQFVAQKSKGNKYKTADVDEMREYILSDRCTADLERLENGDYFLDYPQYRLIAKNFHNRKRAVYSFHGEGGMLLKLLVYSMRDMESKLYSDRLFSFRSDKTATDLLEEISRNKEVSELYVLKTDVSNYVGSIVPELILPMIDNLFLESDPEFCRFLKWIVTRDKVYDRFGNLIDHCPGGLGGVPVGNIFMNLYLHEMDEYFAPRAAFYSRYSDDILICARTEEEILEFQQVFYGFLERLKLSTNKEKTMIIQPGEPFELLGMELCKGRITISSHSMVKIRRKLRKFTMNAFLKYSKGKMTRDEAAALLVRRFNHFFFGKKGSGKLLSWARWAFPVITDTECLKELDHYFQTSLRFVLYGSMKQRKMKIPYEKLHALGYKSLVYYFHHQEKIKELINNSK